MKLIKRLCGILTTTLIVNSLAACNVNVNVGNKNTYIKEIKIGVTLYKQDDVFVSTITKNLEEIAKEKENEGKYKIIINIVDAKGSLINQSNQVDKFVAQNYDVICVNMVDRTAASMIIDKAKSANIPVVFFNREPVEEDMERWNKLYYVGAQAEQSGELQAGIIMNAYEKDNRIVDKNGDGKIQYVMLEGEPGHQDALIRTEYCIKTLTQKGIELEKLADDTANWQNAQANTKMTQWIKNFGNKIEVVFCNNDDMALGAIQALENSGLTEKPLVVGIDGLPKALEAVKNGLMIGTIINDSKKQASAIFNIAYTLATNGDVNSVEGLEKGKYIKTPHTQVTSENVDLYLENKK
ncbi:galactose ABC transporter substrate-binding protein [Clostridium chromiireducens]|uniref:D-galactose/methyl-galactoside binding periplasmic protein MglB n=1 Tax=Clostridium chromiireducens TaxID=225345 RepID=A0A1V4IM43_9CLOT|nr:galactose ABC transporter substrate-binding protein [Clostridium chromiireducens]OPJ60914.1 D-galactose-binding periplasmic protein precursor [Clostridium chromiireducens]RII36301.1 galactose ABC transporter substrate-binding protein [Clostridium chromiireducens]